jgi:signal transduction histidine kinase
VERADRTRCQLERDLHDGVQQRLLALGYQVELARDHAADSDEGLRTVLDRAARLVTTSVTELRQLANGLFPVILHEAGLSAALATFADDAPIRVDLDGLPPDGLPEVTETAAYLTITRLAADAGRRSATHVSAQVRRHGTNLEVDLRDDGRPCDSESLVGLGDRLAVIGGSLHLEVGRTLVVIPCA